MKTRIRFVEIETDDALSTVISSVVSPAIPALPPPPATTGAPNGDAPADEEGDDEAGEASTIAGDASDTSPASALAVATTVSTTRCRRCGKGYWTKEHKESCGRGGRSKAKDAVAKAANGTHPHRFRYAAPAGPYTVGKCRIAGCVAIDVKGNSEEAQAELDADCPLCEEKIGTLRHLTECAAGPKVVLS